LLFAWPVWVSVNIWVPYICYFHVEIFIFLIFKYKIAYYIIVGTNVYNLLNCIQLHIQWNLHVSFNCILRLFFRLLSIVLSLLEVKMHEIEMVIASSNYQENCICC
jgi:hypothetical protein